MLATVAINFDIVGTPNPPQRSSWGPRDCMLYALSVGAGALDPAAELAFTTENTAGVELQALPTMAVAIGPLAGGNAFKRIGDIDHAMVVHGEQAITLHREIPVEGTLEGTSTVTGIYDKGSGALVVTLTSCVLADTGEPLFDLMSSSFVRGEGGFGGDTGPRNDRKPLPDRPPEHEVAYPTRIDQALLYRLNNDRNPLHSDPAYAARGGFDRPILHGLCTYGFAGRALVNTVLGGDSSRMQSMFGRFTSPVFPGEALTTRAWEIGPGEVAFQTVADDGRVVLDLGHCTFST